MTYYPIWEGIYPYKNVEASILLATGWKMLQLENDKYLPYKEFFEKCSSMEWKCHEQNWRKISAEWGQYRIPRSPLRGKKLSGGMYQYLIYPVILPIKRDSGSIEDCTVGFQVCIENLREQKTGKKQYFVKVEGSENW